jgi:hypothetical protein
MLILRILLFHLFVIVIVAVIVSLCILSIHIM